MKPAQEETVSPLDKLRQISKAVTEDKLQSKDPSTRMQGAVHKIVQMKDDQLVANMKREENSIQKVRETVKRLQQQLSDKEDTNRELRVTVQKQQDEIDEISMMLKTAQMQVAAWCNGPKVDHANLMESMRLYYEEKCKKLSDILAAVSAKNRAIWGPVMSTMRDINNQASELSSSTRSQMDDLLTNMKQDILLAFAEANPKDWVEPDICEMPHVSEESVAGMQCAVNILTRAIAQVMEVVGAVQEYNLPDADSGDEPEAHIISQQLVLKRLTDVVNGLGCNLLGRFKEMQDQQNQNCPENIEEEQV